MIYTWWLVHALHFSRMECHHKRETKQRRLTDDDPRGNITHAEQSYALRNQITGARVALQASELGSFQLAPSRMVVSNERDYVYEHERARPMAGASVPLRFYYCKLSLCDRC